jgi:cell wall-associated NlpC family hydrolase
MRTTFVNNNIALGANDAAKGGYTAAYTFGAPQFGGQANAAYVGGTRQAAGFAYASPTIGYSGAMTAAQQTYSARSFAMSQAMGLASPILQGGQQNSMSNIAASMVSRTFQGRTKVSQKELDAALRQGGSMSTNLAYWGQQMGWSSQTTQTYENYIRGMNAAANKGMSRSEYDKLTQTAATGNGDAKKDALATLKKTTGMGASMFERQRDLNATRLTRQEDILESLAPAFEKATDMVDKFSEALTKFLQVTHLDNLVGTGAGWASALSGGMSGLASGFGMGAGALGAFRLLGGASGGAGGLGTLLSTLFGGAAARGGAGAAARGGAGALSGMIQGTRGASGAYNITNAGGRAATAARTGGLIGGLTTAGALFLVQGHSGGGLYQDYLSRKNKDGYSKEDVMKYTFQWIKENKDEAMDRGWLYKDGVNKGQVKPDKFDEIKKQIHVEDNLKAIAQAEKEGRLTGTDGQPGGAGGGKSGADGGKANASGSGSAADAIRAASQQIGDPYVWGGVGPDGWDCSGLIQWAYKQAGVKIPRTSQQQQKIGKAVATDKVQPGDLLFNGNPAHHVVMAIGGGKIIEAPRTGLKVRIRSFKPGEFTNARRILGSIGNLSDISTEGGDGTTLNDQADTVGGDVGGAYGGTSELAALMSVLSGSTGGGAMGLASQATSSTSVDDSGTGDVSGKTPPGNPKGNIALGKKMAAKEGWTGNQWKALYNLWMGESGWDEHADNPSSDAYGIPQAMSNIHKETATAAWRNSAEKQIAWGIKYIKGRYGNPAKAWSFWNSKNPHWYDEGAWNLDQDATARVHKGEMILPAKQAESVRNAITNTLTTGTSSSGGGGGIHFDAGAIVVNPTPGMTSQEARLSGKMIVDAVLDDARIKELQKGH